MLPKKKYVHDVQTVLSDCICQCNIFFFLIGFIPCIAHGSFVNKWEPMGMLTAGPGFSRIHENKTLTLLPPWTNFYKASHTNQSTELLGLTLGAVSALNDTVDCQLGLSGYINTNMSFSGHVWQFSLPEFDNFVYRYHVNSSRLMLTVKTPFHVKTIYHPYLAGEMGAALNRSSHYVESPLAVEAFAMQPFANASHTSFAWDIGGGIDVDVTSKIRLGVGYLWIDAGKASLGSSVSAASAQTLGVKHLYTNQVLFQLTAFL